ASWALGAHTVWRSIEQLSAQSRRALEEAWIAERDGAASDGATPLLGDVVRIMREKPTDIFVNLFDLKAAQINELHNWFNALAHASQQHVAYVAEILKSQRSHHQVVINDPSVKPPPLPKSVRET